MSTEAEMGYEDAIRQVTKSLQRRRNALMETAEKDPTRAAFIAERVEEIDHLLQIVESLHR
ncbi:MAG: hypothetical protein OWQ59_09050 [Alicyclobacillaceae bacterium]|uniref:hypothetical protein n=1 Tax=Alicyclobacillus sp. SP_1 TaxID=2942475 RepID=UPI002157C01B|nr:hypothetical protein [Alicyclobacillus sp. SP_1]MCY0888586.1 hypothetical protein [Alicyclobacillaceae bacterium]MCY0896159.1 hypothetical protein [Alicyclobacillaceae bacterium]